MYVLYTRNLTQVIFTRNTAHMICLSIVAEVTKVCSCGLETEGLHVRGLLEPASWPCVGAQVKDWSHVVIWAACKITHNQYETI